VGTRSGPRHPVDNGAALAPDEVDLGPKGGAGPADLRRRPGGVPRAAPPGIGDVSPRSSRLPPGSPAV